MTTGTSRAAKEDPFAIREVARRRRGGPRTQASKKGHELPGLVFRTTARRHLSACNAMCDVAEDGGIGITMKPAAARQVRSAASSAGIHPVTVRALEHELPLTLLDCIGITGQRILYIFLVLGLSHSSDEKEGSEKETHGAVG